MRDRDDTAAGSAVLTRDFGIIDTGFQIQYERSSRCRIWLTTDDLLQLSTDSGIPVIAGLRGQILDLPVFNELSGQLQDGVQAISAFSQNGIATRIGQYKACGHAIALQGAIG